MSGPPDVYGLWAQMSNRTGAWHRRQAFGEAEDLAGSAAAPSRRCGIVLEERRPPAITKLSAWTLHRVGLAFTIDRYQPGENGWQPSNCGLEEQADVRLVPDLPVAHAREITETAAVASRCGAHEVGEGARTGAARADACTAARTRRPRGRRLHVDERDESPGDGIANLIVD